jgi:hypothetical protein
LRAKGKILKQQSTGRHAQGFFPPAAAALLLLAASSLSGFESNASLAQDASTPLPIAAPVAKPTAGPVIKTTTTTTTTTITTTKNTDSDDLSIAPTPLILSTANLGGSVDSLQPVIVFDKIIAVDEDGQTVNRYLYRVANAEALPANIFVKAPYLKPLSENADASRTWVYVLDQDGNPLSTFATINDRTQLAKLWFAAQTQNGIALPKKIYVDIWDRQMDVHYRSKLVAVPQ